MSLNRINGIYIYIYKIFNIIKTFYDVNMKKKNINIDTCMYMS